AGALAGGVVLGVAAAVVAGGAVLVRDTRGQAGIDESLQRLVHRRQADVGDFPSHAREDLLGGRVAVDRPQVAEDRGALARKPPAGPLQGLPEFFLVAGAARGV